MFDHWNYLLASAALHGAVLFGAGSAFVTTPVEYAQSSERTSLVRVRLVRPAAPTAPESPAVPPAPPPEPAKIPKSVERPRAPAKKLERQSAPKEEFSPPSIQQTPAIDAVRNNDAPGDQDAARGALRRATAADYLSNPPPMYPAISRRLHEEGTAVIRVTIDAAGSVSSAELETSSAHERLDRAALDAVQGWRFKPPTVLGIRVGGTVLVPVRFVLKGR